MTVKKFVHIIDDEDAVRRSAGYMLKTSGYSVETWVSGVSFLKEARSSPVRSRARRHPCSAM